MFMVAKQILTLLNILIIYSLQHLIYAIVGGLLVALYVYPQTAVDIVDGGPHTIPAEEVVAVHLTYIRGVVLGPFNVHLPHATNRVSRIFVVLTEVELEVYVVPIGCLRP